jgi:hypothetical protein
MAEPQTSITINGKEYRLDSLSDQARAQLTNLRAVDQEIKKLEQQLAIFKTAQAAYARVLKQEIDKAEPVTH